MKICSKCKRELDESNFYKNKNKKDGLCAECKDCTKEYGKKYFQTYRKHGKKVSDNLIESTFRICKKCGAEKNIEEFVLNKNCSFGREYTCKCCRKEKFKNYGKEYRKNNKEKIKIYYDKHYKENNEEIKKRSREQYDEKIKNPVTRAKYRNHKKEYRLKNPGYNKNYYLNNKEKIEETNKKYLHAHRKECNARQLKYIKARNKTDASFRIKGLLRSRILKVIKGHSKSAHTMELIGCTIEFLMNYLQQTAINNGYGDFDINDFNSKIFNIDHIIPCSLFHLDKQTHQFLCFNWSNLQILTALENDSKKAKLDFRLLKEFSNDSPSLQISQGFPFHNLKDTKMQNPIDFKVDQITAENEKFIKEEINRINKEIKSSKEHLGEIEQIKLAA
jgi:hypothetical protein